MFEHIQERPSLFSRLLYSRRVRLVLWAVVIWSIAMAILLAAWATPYYSIWSMKTAAQNRDAEKFCSFIDLPLLRENLKAELNAKMLYEMGKDQKLKDNPFAGLAAIAAPAMINNMIDGYLTPSDPTKRPRRETRPFC